METLLDPSLDTLPLDQNTAVSKDEDATADGELIPAGELNVPEARCRYETRSRSMPLILPACENLPDGTINIQSPLKLKGRQHLRLPSFKALGIAVPHPDHLLTPPEEPDQFAWQPHSQPLPHLQEFDIPRSIPLQALKLTPEDESSMAAPLDSEGLVSGNNTTTLPEVLAVVDEESEMRPTSSSSEGDSPGGPTWLEHAIDAVVSTVPVIGMTSNVLYTLCHTQPCPLSGETSADPTAFNLLVTALQGKLEQGQFIEITYAVPPKFNMNLLPKSPMATPNLTSASGEVDYFSMNVFSKAVVAVDHSVAIVSSLPSSPRPVVAPSTVGITCLERYIPPSRIEEYNDLFSTNKPSALVDRLTELSANGGNLIFIYPTNFGGSTFTSKYLNPLLDPLLRTMIQIHGLSADLGKSVGTMAAVSKMLAYEQMIRKISTLFRKLGQMAHHPRFTLVQSSKETIQLDRKVWMEWWLQQETPRIREEVKSYYKRGSRLPQGKEKTESALVWEIMDGVQMREYDDANAGHEGIEVGVFVIKRTG